MAIVAVGIIYQERTRIVWRTPICRWGNLTLMLVRVMAEMTYLSATFVTAVGRCCAPDELVRQHRKQQEDQVSTHDASVAKDLMVLMTVTVASR